MLANQICVLYTCKSCPIIGELARWRVTTIHPFNLIFLLAQLLLFCVYGGLSINNNNNKIIYNINVLDKGCSDYYGSIVSIE